MSATDSKGSATEGRDSIRLTPKVFLDVTVRQKQQRQDCNIHYRKQRQVFSVRYRIQRQHFNVDYCINYFVYSSVSNIENIVTGVMVFKKQQSRVRCLSSSDKLHHMCKLQDQYINVQY